MSAGPSSVLPFRIPNSAFRISSRPEESTHTARIKSPCAHLYTTTLRGSRVFAFQRSGRRIKLFLRANSP